MERCKDVIRREFYLKSTKKFGWTKDVLIYQLEAVALERFMAKQHGCKLLPTTKSLCTLICLRLFHCLIKLLI